ncbi:lysophospholipid transporter LplT [Brevibacillus fulvus]|uniref:LPLT family lysophospholipid transporter-like MFS transporter n=1 Tax=Brevibacillus fulvus TaxID=1125967 RepID=A0A938XZ10_9BACL|nr:lysophospholipid transporter LplT [Brevibacillus fulvus]MBM7590300.1 LPLT family lysophospholipid transporter-like MFS transporter [Brevibacillus fulvus]
MKLRMKPLPSLYLAQFLSAFADNMILFVIANLLSKNGFSQAALALVSIFFFLPYLVLAPLVGALADKHPKTLVLIVGNLVKALGLLLLIALDHSQIVVLILSYFTVGVGAVIYSPAKYGILPELTATEDELFRANAKMEAYTIVAILAGIGLGGAIAATAPVNHSTLLCLLLYLLSPALTMFIPRQGGDASIRYRTEARQFVATVRLLFHKRQTRFSLVGTGAFWMSSAVLRIAVLAWIPAALHIDPDSIAVSLILATTSIGIVAGAFLAPRLVPLRKLERVLRFGFLLFALILLFPWFPLAPLTIALLLLVGFMGGLFIVPMNTILQEEGKTLVGTGKTIAVQNFVENLLMMIGSAVYYLFVYTGGAVSGAIVLQACLLLLFLLYLSRHKPRAAVSTKSKQL